MSLPITDQDHELIKAAEDCIRLLYTPDRHQVAAAIRTASGKIVTGINTDANVGRIGVCAEAITLGRMLSEGTKEFTTIVAVYHSRPEGGDSEVKVVAPCGMCRELITDYNSEAQVIYADGGEIKKARMLDLLPAKYAR